MSDRILVTGATGFVGSHVVDRLLETGARVRVTVRSTSKMRWLEGKSVECVEADLRSPEQLRRAVAGASAVLHFGGKIRVRKKSDFFAANAVGTEALAKAFAAEAPEDGSGLFLYCSSLAAGGPAPEIERLPFPHVTEEDAPRPVSPYGDSKLQGERRLELLKGRARVVILRPPGVYGPRDRGIYKYFRWLDKGFLIRPGREDGSFSLIHVSDLAEATAMAVENPKAQGLYYVSDGHAHRWRGIGKIASEIMGVKARTLPIPMALLYSGALIGEIFSRLTGRAPLLSLAKMREINQKYWVCLPTKATSEFGFRPKVDIETGLSETISWYRKRGWLRGPR